MKGLLAILYFLFIQQVYSQNDVPAARNRISMNDNWKFFLGDEPAAQNITFDDTHWRTIQLPHDWSIEGDLDEKSPAKVGGGALNGGTGWYRKTFQLDESKKDKNVFIDFDGIYRNSEVWINGHYLGLRPNGYISFRYDLTPFLVFGKNKNVLVVKVDNSRQPNSRWYSGSGIYRNVWLIITGKTYVIDWGTYITTPKITEKSALIHLEMQIYHSSLNMRRIKIVNTVLDEKHRLITSESLELKNRTDTLINLQRDLKVPNPILWSVDQPYLYQFATEIWVDGKMTDRYSIPVGIRYFKFDTNDGFSLNGKSIKINGVCNHHDLGSLGSAVYLAGLYRQLTILKKMGCNAIRTSHNPPASELLDLCDKMGFIVMDEAFDMWKMPKNLYDYSLDWDQWHKKDLQDQVLRDRNHPSVMIWSIGNEINEQWNEKDSSGIFIALELASILKSLDTTRPVTAALNDPYPKNNLIRSGALDLIGYNYHHKDFADFHKRFPGQKFIGTETVSAFETRGYYEMPSDSISRFANKKNAITSDGRIINPMSSYDNAAAIWGSTHEETLKEILKYKFLSGQFIWTGFDYLGEPTPYGWPSHISYFGIIDLAGFPKDIYYLYQSVWTDSPVLHIFPHWNWKENQEVDIWAYYNKADEVELYLNGKSMGVRNKYGDDLHVNWKLKFQPGTLKAISRKDGKSVLIREVKTAGPPAKIILRADRNILFANGNDLGFISVEVVDKNGIRVPDADNLVKFQIEGNASIVAVDNGNPASLESFKANSRKAFNGQCLVIIKTEKSKSPITITATAEGLESGSVNMVSEN